MIKVSLVELHCLFVLIFWMQPWPEYSCSSSTRFESMRGTIIIKWSTYSFTAKSMNFQVIFIIFCSCSVCFEWCLSHKKTGVLLKDALSGNFLHLYFLAPPCAVNARKFLSCDFAPLQKFSLSIFRSVALLIPCLVLSHGSLNEK